MVAGANTSTPLSAALLQRLWLFDLKDTLLNIENSKLCKNGRFKRPGLDIPYRVKIIITYCKSNVYNTLKEMYPLVRLFLPPHPLTSTIFSP